jgi:hypothetical protein
MAVKLSALRTRRTLLLRNIIFMFLVLISVRNMHYSTPPADMKTEIEKLGHQVTNIWNITQYRTKLPLSMFFVELKPAPNNKDIFLVEYLQQCKIKFEALKHKRDIVQCANCQRYGHTKNYSHLKSRCVKCAGDHSTHLCHRKDRSKDVKCVLCGGNHPANYKGCTAYKELQQKTYPPLQPKQYLPPSPLTPPLEYLTLKSPQTSRPPLHSPIKIPNLSHPSLKPPISMTLNTR